MFQSLPLDLPVILAVASLGLCFTTSLWLVVTSMLKGSSHAC